MMKARILIGAGFSIIKLICVAQIIIQVKK